MNLRELFKKSLTHLFILLVTTAIFWKYLVFEEYLIFGDLRYITYPFKVVLCETLKNWSLPLWNPDIQLGFPLLAEGQTGVFYPFNLIFSFISPTPIANNLNIVLHVYLSGAFLYIYARTISLDRYISIISALIFMFSGFVVSRTHQINILHELVWLPLAFTFLELLLRKGRVWYSFWLGLVLSIQYLGGQPQISAYTILALTLYLAFHIVLDIKILNQLFSSKNALILLIAFCLGIGIAAIQLFPTWELLQHSVRKANFSLDETQVGSFSPVYFLNYLFPFFFITPGKGGSVNFWGGAHYSETFSYVGILPLILSFMAIKRGRDKVTIFFVFLLAISWIIALGRYNPLNSLLYHITGLGYFRVPARFLLLSTFSLAIMSGKGLDLLLKMEKGKIEKSLGHAFKYLIFICFIIILSLIMVKILILANPIISKNNYEIFLNQTLSLDNSHILIPLLWAIGALLLLAYWKNKGTSRVVKSLIFIFIVGDLSYFSTKFYSINQWKGASIYWKYNPETVNFLNKDKSIYRICSLTNKVIFGQELTNEMLLNSNYNMIHHISSISIFSPLAMQRHQEIEDIIKKSVYYLTPNSSILAINNLQIFDLLNVKYILSLAEIRGNGLMLVFQEELVRIYQNMNVLPRAFIVFEAKEIRDSARIRDELTSKDFSGQDYVILEENIPHDKGDKDFSYTSALKVRAKIVQYTPKEISILAQLPRSGYLVLSDTYYPGWNAYVDGIATKIFGANYLMRAVALSEGTHWVVFRYEPLSFKIGLYITLSSLFLGFIICIVFHWSQQRVR